METKRRSDLEWQEDAACRNLTVFLELPEHGGWTDKQRLRLCRGHTVDELIIEPRCPVINQCLTYALTLPAADVGHRGIVFGGHTGQHIAKWIRQGKPVATR